MLAGVGSLIQLVSENPLAARGIARSPFRETLRIVGRQGRKSPEDQFGFCQGGQLRNVLDREAQAIVATRPDRDRNRDRDVKGRDDEREARRFFARWHQIVDRCGAEQFVRDYLRRWRKP